MHHTALLYNPLHEALSHKLNNNSSHYTVYIQIFEIRKFLLVNLSSTKFKSLKFYKSCNTLEAQGVIHEIHENKIVEIL